MTEPTSPDAPELLPVTQGDRDAAADLWLKNEGEPYSLHDKATAAEIQMGNRDDWDFVQSFAAHRHLVLSDPNQNKAGGMWYRRWFKAQTELVRTPASPSGSDVERAREIAFSILDAEWERRPLSQKRRDIGRNALLNGQWDNRAEVQCALAALRTKPDTPQVDKLEAALLEVLDAVRDYLPPDGISKDDCLSRVIGAVDNPTINPIIREIENGRS